MECTVQCSATPVTLLLGLVKCIDICLIGIIFIMQKYRKILESLYTKNYLIKGKKTRYFNALAEYQSMANKDFLN